MKYILGAVFLVLVAMSFGAVWWVPEAGDDRTVLHWVTDDSAVRQAQIALFNANHDDYRVELDPGSGGMEKVILQCLAGVGPDIFDCYSAFQLRTFVRAGIALDITEGLAVRGVDPLEQWPCVYPMTMIEDRAYGHAGNANAKAMWINKAEFAAAGIPLPEPGWTWEDCMALAEKMTRRDDRGRPVQFGLMLDKWDWRFVFLSQWGGAVYSPEGTRCMLDSEAAQSAMQFYYELMHVHKIVPTAADEVALASTGGWGTPMMSQFATGRGAMAVGGRWWLVILRKPDYQVELTAIPLPVGPSADTFGTGRSTLVNSKGENIEGALAFVEFMHSREWTQLVNARADALGPVKKYHYGKYEDAFLHNPDYPEENYNLVWRTALENAQPHEASPFVHGRLADRIMEKQTDLVREGSKDGRQAMVDACKEINKAIRERLEIDPELKQKYDALVSDGAPSAWD